MGYKDNINIFNKQNINIFNKHGKKSFIFNGSTFFWTALCVHKNNEWNVKLANITDMHRPSK